MGQRGSQSGDPCMNLFWSDRRRIGVLISRYPAIRANALRRNVPICSTNGRSAVARTIRKRIMAWTTPTLVEICIGLEINGYLPAEF
jgi:coenzyme PQQ precursor peptide PqqA